MKRMVLISLIVGIAFLFTSCGAAGSSGADNDPANETINNTSETTSTNQNEKYMEYIQKNLPNDGNYQMAFFSEEQDLDSDGYSEIIIMREDQNIYILRDENGKISQVIDNIYNEGGGYVIDEIKLVKLKGSDSTYIFFHLTNEASLNGFALLQLRNNQINQIVYSASATGAGNDYLDDSDNDGIFDSYVQERWSYDVLYYNTLNYYVWNNKSNAFIFSNSQVDVGDYADNIHDLIIQYLSLKCIDSAMSQEINERLAEIFPEGDGNFSVNDLKNNPREILSCDPDINMNITENGNDAYVKVVLTSISDSSLTDTINFNLKQEDGKWRIIKVAAEH